MFESVLPYDFRLPHPTTHTCYTTNFRGLKFTLSQFIKMADESAESLVKGRETRRNAGSLMSKLIEDEQDVDDFYKTAFGGFEEESGDDQYATEDEEVDVVDSDFSVSETDEVIDDPADEEPKRKRKKQVIKPYKFPKKDASASKAASKDSEAKKEGSLKKNLGRG